MSVMAGSEIFASSDYEILNPRLDQESRLSARSSNMALEILISRLNELLLVRCSRLFDSISGYSSKTF
jgi:hypothetical protein